MSEPEREQAYTLITPELSYCAIENDQQENFTDQYDEEHYKRIEKMIVKDIDQHKKSCYINNL